MTARVSIAVMALATAAACGGASRGSDRSRMTTKEIVVKSKPAIVRVVSPLGIGTGFFVSNDGRIATNLHVIHGATELAVVLSDDSQLVVTKVVAVDAEHDLAIIAVSPPGKPPILQLGDSDKVEAGDRVIAIGNPLGVLDYTVSDGLISSVRSVRGNTVLQISAPISFGSSGGPLFNTYGEVIGIATFIAERGQNLNFGMPSNYIKPLLAQTGGVSVAEFAKKSGGQSSLAQRLANPDAPPPTGSGNSPKIKREVPDHPLSRLAGCSDDILVEIFAAIRKAIEVGAPVYNSGDHEACFGIYRKVIESYEKDPRVCKGVREALGQGLLRAGSLGDKEFTAKAWALRDTFDGLLAVIVKKAGG